ncbi:recombinase family protein, partial [Candidatus Poribacteria bacterium]|nr:recombinase family protein [Candidatus Poribacteria bacterium]
MAEAGPTIGCAAKGLLEAYHQVGRDWRLAGTDGAGFGDSDSDRQRVESDTMFRTRKRVRHSPLCYRNTSMKHHPDSIPAALYARVSSDRQDVDLSVAAQLRALRDFAQRNGYAVSREYVDEAESGRVADRPQFRKMLDEASGPNAPFQEILVWKFSRFTRKREHAVAFKSMLRRRGIRVTS